VVKNLSNTYANRARELEKILRKNLILSREFPVQPSPCRPVSSENPPKIDFGTLVYREISR
jgi:hypothetical protein